MRRTSLVVFALWLTMASMPAAAVPLIRVALDLDGNEAHAGLLIAEGNITRAGLPAGFTEPWFFDEPGALTHFSFDSRPGFPGLPWHYRLDNNESHPQRRTPEHRCIHVSARSSRKRPAR